MGLRHIVDTYNKTSKGLDFILACKKRGITREMLEETRHVPKRSIYSRRKQFLRNMRKRHPVCFIIAQLAYFVRHPSKAKDAAQYYRGEFMESYISGGTSA